MYVQPFTPFLAQARAVGGRRASHFGNLCITLSRRSASIADNIRLVYAEDQMYLNVFVVLTKHWVSHCRGDTRHTVHLRFCFWSVFSKIYLARRTIFKSSTAALANFTAIQIEVTL